VKTFKLNVNGQDYTVQIDDPNASPVSVTVNGKPFQVTLTEEGVAAVQPVVTAPVVDEQEYQAYVPDMASTFVTQVVDVPEAPVAAAASAVPAAGAAKVTAPMPGKVLDIVAKIGQAVKTGDTLCNLEAMKMKSPIRSTADGTVAQIAVSEGQNVNYGDVLFVLA